MPDVISIIAARLCTGEPLHKICQDPDMPSLPMLYGILRSDADARAVIEQARQDAAHTLAWQMIEIADEPMIGSETTTEEEGTALIGADGEPDIKPGIHTKTRTKTYDNVARTAQRLRAREWLAKRLCPASYADRIEQHQTGAQSLTIITGVPDPDPDGTDADADDS